MTSLAEDAYVGTLHYKLLDPPISVGGGVQNPMDANLDGGGFDITNVNALTTGTLNYTTLNPPLPTSGVANPMIVNLDGGNFNITNVNAFESATVTATGNVGGADITATGAIGGATGNVSGNMTVGGNMTVSAGGRLISDAVCELNSTTDISFLRRIQWKAPATFGTKLAPIVFGLGPGVLNVDMGSADNRSVLCYCTSSGQGSAIQFDVYTALTDVLANYVVDITVNTVIASTPPTPYVRFTDYQVSPVLISAPSDPSKFNVALNLNAPPGTSIFKVQARLIRTD